MPTVVLSQSGSGNAAMRLEVQYTAGNGSLSITRIRSARNDGFSTFSAIAAGRVIINIGGNTREVNPPRVDFNSNSSWSTISGATHSRSNLSGNTAITVTFRGWGVANIDNSRFTTTVNAGFAAPAMTISNTTRGLNSIGMTLGWTQTRPTTIEVYNNTTRLYSGSSLTPTLTGLNPNTTYALRVRGNAGNGWGNYSGTTNVTTFDIARISAAPNFNDTANPVINFSNPSGAPLDAKMEVGGNANFLVRSSIANTGSYTFALTQAERDRLLAAAPNSNSLAVRFTIATRIGSTPTWSSSLDRTMTVTAANPTFTTFAYADTNGATLALTGDSQRIINGYSLVRGTVPSANRMIPNKGSTGRSYTFTAGNKSSTANFSATADVNMDVGTVTTGVFQMQAVDSRGNSTTVQRNIGNHLINYLIPRFSKHEIERVGGVGTTIELTAEGTYDAVNFGMVTNAISRIEMRTRALPNEAWSDWANITSHFEILNGKFSINKALFPNFALGTMYEIQLRVTDSLNTITSPILTLSDGRPILAINKSKKLVGVGVLPNANLPEGSMDASGYYLEGQPLLSVVYPIGAIYMSVNNVNPSTLFGGTWVAWGTGRVPVGVDTAQAEFNTVERAGGAKTHTLSIGQMPRHGHRLTRPPWYSADTKHGSAGSIFHQQSTTTQFAVDGDGRAPNLETTGSGEAHNNLQPYITCFMWKRTA